MSATAELEAELLDVAVAGARAGGAELLARWRRPLEVNSKSTPTDPVSEADLAAEHAIREILGRSRPHDSILGEEGGATGDGDLRWVVDPLDGTVNYLYGLPTFAVSIAVEDSDGGLAAAVLDPVADEIFTATRSGAPMCNGDRVTPSGCGALEAALVGTGFGYDSEVRGVQAEVAARVIPLARHVLMRRGTAGRLLRARRQAVGRRGRHAHLPARRPGRTDAPAPRRLAVGGSGRARRVHRRARRIGLLRRSAPRLSA
jgi:myo-inositol-1(or 4)-monophosphatase